MIKAVIFDLDGVISDTDRTRFDLLKKLLKNRGISLMAMDYPQIIGKRTKTFLTEKFGSLLTDLDIEQICSDRIQEFRKNPTKYIYSQPYVNKCCQTLFNSGFILAIASNTQTVDITKILNQLKILSFFKIIIGSDSVTNFKPHPELYLKCLEELNLAKDECIAIEDSPTGIKSAKSAGIFCVAVTYTHNAEELTMADHITNSLNKVPAYVSKLNS